MICVVKLCYAPRQTHILMTCTCNCSMHIQHNVMQLFHANSAPACTRSRSPHNVLHSPSIYAAQFFLYQECNYRTSCRKSLPARILRVIASCVNSNHKHCNVNDLDTNHERSTSTRMETIAHGEGLKHFMKTGRVLQAISCPACRAHHGV